MLFFLALRSTLNVQKIKPLAGIRNQNVFFLGFREKFFIAINFFFKSERRNRTVGYLCWKYFSSFESV